MHQITQAPILVWFRQDLRLKDNPALSQAGASPIIPLFIWDENAPYLPGGASKWWLDKSLRSLQHALHEKGLKLILRRGNPLDILQDLIGGHSIQAIYWNDCYEPYARARDQRIKDFFHPDIECQSFNGSLLTDPTTLMSKSGTPYQIYTPYWNNLKAQLHVPSPSPTPSFKPFEGSVKSDNLAEWNLHPTHPDWSKGLEEEWTPGEEGAHARLHHFLDGIIDNYSTTRDLPSKEGTSKLSPHLHWGELSPKQVWHSVMVRSGGNPSSGAWTYLSEIAWREFSYYLLYHFPHLPEKPLRKAFDDFPWRNDPEGLTAWQRGMTGYPIVDAGMRQLWHTGWMHNRVRMIAASFLVKDLLIPWQDGESWFWDTLVDADLASNSASWQWVAGCGTDAAPFFRIFNPITQGQKFDPDGSYIKKWVPELSTLPSKYIHAPWTAPEGILSATKVKLGSTYPFPIVDHQEARMRALEAFKIISSKGHSQ